MHIVARSRPVTAPLPDVWDALADFAAISRWAPDVDHSCLLGGDEPLTLVRRVQVGRTVLVERVVEWDAPQLLAYRIEGLPPVVRSVVNEWSLAEQGPASTRVTLTTTIDTGPRPPQQLVARIVGQRLAKASDAMLEGLAAHVTSGDP